MNPNVHVIIMAGGVGTRFWPMSRSVKPKQFIDILGVGKSLLQQTYDRFLNVCSKENIMVVTNEQYTEIVRHQLPALDENNILAEPARRNTAPCVAYAAFKIKQRNPDAILVIAPSDHLIEEQDLFEKTINQAIYNAEQNEWLITLGILPSRPDTGYGYIQFLGAESGNETVRKVKTFTEKPQLELARTFIRSGDFLWNSGMFVWSLKSILNAFEKYAPEMYEQFALAADDYNTTKEKDAISKVYLVCKNISIDYAIMEKASNVYVIISDFTWSDLGTWGSLYEKRLKDSKGNSVVGKNVMLYDTQNCIVHVPKEKLVLLQGLDNYVVVESDGILMVVRKDDEQNIRQYVNDVLIEKGENFV